MPKDHDKQGQGELASFPQLNPNPVLEIDTSGKLLYANPAAHRLFPDIAHRKADHALLSNLSLNTITGTTESEVEIAGQWYCRTLIHAPEKNSLRLYCTNITKRKQKEDEIKKYMLELQENNEKLKTSQKAALDIMEEAINANKALREAKQKLSRINEELEERVAARTQEVSAERERLYAVLESLPAYVVLLTPDYHVSFANKDFRRRFGEDRGRPCYEFLFNRSSPCENCETYKVFKTKKPHHWEWIGPDNHNYDIYDFPFKEKDGSINILEMGVDVTELKRAQSALLQAEKDLHDSKRLSDIGTLAATIAHELRNPLGVIRIAAYNIKKKDQNGSVAANIANIEKMVLNSEQIINNLLFYSRLQSPALQTVRIDKLLEETINHSEAQHKDFAVFIKKDIAGLDSLKIQADPIQLQELFSNLLNNAFESLPEKKGQITVTGNLDKENNFLQISIRDNGVGIALEDLPEINRPFFTRKARGTGLGLTVCQQVVSLHHGKMEVKSELGKGSIFSISLPSHA